MSDSPFPHDKSDDGKFPPGHHPNSKRNLLPPAKKGEVRNPLGHNGRTRAEILVDVMEESSESDPERMKIEMVVRSQYRRALKGSDIAARTLLEHYKGLPKRGSNVILSDGIDKTRSTYDIALETYRERLLSGEMSEDELLAVTKIFAEAEKAEAEMIARILGDKSEQSKALRERVENLLARMEARMNAAESPKVIEAQVVDGEGKAPSE